MHTSFLTILSLVSVTLVGAAPLDARTLNFGKGGSAQSGYSGSVDGGSVYNSGGFVVNTAFASKHLFDYFIVIPSMLICDLSFQTRAERPD